MAEAEIDEALASCGAAFDSGDAKGALDHMAKVQSRENGAPAERHRIARTRREKKPARSA